jgi:hypothetical protein
MRYSRKLLRREQGILGVRQYQEEHAFVVRSLAQLRAARTARDHYELQRGVLSRFIQAQDYRDALLGARSVPKQIIARLSEAADPDVATIRRNQEVLRGVGRQSDAVNALLHVYRVLGDGIAWRTLNYDRAVISVLGEGTRVGRIASEPGRSAELGRLQAFWDEEGVFAIHNDATNCLRVGDLTVIRHHAEGGYEAGLVEVKMRGEAGAAQLRRMEGSVQLVNTGSHSTAAHGEPLRIVRVPTLYKTGLDGLGPLIEKVRQDGYAWTQPSSFLTVGAFDISTTNPITADELAQIVRAEQERMGWFNRPERVLTWTGTLRRIRERRSSDSALAPMSIYPIPAEAAADLMMGFIEWVAYLNLDLVEAAFRERGIRANAPGLPGSADLFLRAERGNAQVVVPPSIRDQVMIEWMTPDCLIASVEHRLSQINNGGAAGKAIITLSREQLAWESSLG